MEPQTISGMDLSGIQHPIGEIIGNVYQIAILNNMLPPGYRLELPENINRVKLPQLKTGKRKTAVIIRFNLRKLNEVR